MRTHKNIPNVFSVTHDFINSVVVSTSRGIMKNVMGIFHALSFVVVVVGGRSVV